MTSQPKDRNKCVTFCRALFLQSLWVVVIFLFSQQGYAQVEKPNQTTFDLYFKNPTLVTPAALEVKHKAQAAVGNRSLTGAFVGVHRSYVDLSVMTNSAQAKTTTKHFVGVQLISNRDGSYFQRNRAYLRYGVSVPLSKSLRLNSGIALGTVNYVFQSSNSGSGGSDFCTDASLGVLLSHENFTLGISGQQLLARPLTPVEYTYYLDPYLVYNGSGKIDLSPFFYAHVYALADHNLVEGSLSYQVVTTVDYRNMVEFGLGYNQRKGGVIVAGVPEIAVRDWVLNLYASYLVYNPNNVSKLIDRSVEFSLGLIFPN